MQRYTVVRTVIPEIPPAVADAIEPVRLEAADRLGSQIIRFVRSIARVGAHFAAHRKDGVEGAAYALLAHLITEGPRRTTALAEALHSDPSTISRQTAALVRLGLVERRSDQMDGRVCLLVATDEGERVFAEHRRRRDAHLAAMLAGWSESELRQFTFLLDRFNSDLEAYRPQLLGLGRDMDHQEEGENTR